MFSKRPLLLVLLFVGATVGQILSETKPSTDVTPESEKVERSKGEVSTLLTSTATQDLQPAAS
jgi:hypothetical protein